MGALFGCLSPNAVDHDMTDLPAKPQIYNRPWHLDLDDRRHHGRRQWERGALEQLIALIGGLDSVYPPDWSDSDVVRFRVPGLAEPFAEVRTDDPARVVLMLRKGLAFAVVVAADLPEDLPSRLAEHVRSIKR
jgi:hypothetical protein